jgi:hypothetical protein
VQLSVGAVLHDGLRLDQEATVAAAQRMVDAGATVVSVVLPAGLPTMDDALRFVGDLGACVR